MVKLKRFFIMILLFLGLFLLNVKVQSASELSPILKADGTNLKFRGTNTNVMGLTNYEYKVQDFRSTWVATVSNLDIGRQQSIESYKDNLRTIINDLKSWGMNAIIFQIRPMNDSFYDSDLNHWSLYLNNGEHPGWDMLSWLIEESHKAGLEFHAWLNPYRITTTAVESIEAYAQSVAEKNALYGKNNLASNPDMLLKTNTGGLIFNPGEPAVRQFLIDTVEEIVEKYDVDAIHFDDYFYANLENDTSDNITMQKYPISGINNKADWRREQVTTFIRDLSNFLKNFNIQNNRVVQLGVSPTGIWANRSSNPNGSNTAGFEHYGHYLYADTRKWVKENYLDYILPQTYWGLEHSTAAFADLAKWWAETVQETDVNLYLGNGLYMERPGYNRTDWVNKPNEIDNQLKVMGAYPEIQGYCFFRYETVKTVSPQYISGYNGIELIKNDYWKKLIPGVPLRRYLNVVTEAPVRIMRTSASYTWDKVENARGYVVYQVNKGVSLDQNNPDHIYTYIADNAIEIDNNENFDVYVASVSKANNISPATKYSFSLDTVENIMQALYDIPNPVSLNDQNIVSAIRSAYDKLNATDKAAITNYDLLIRAEQQISILLSLKAEADNISGKIPRQIKNNYLLPTTNSIGAAVNWQYASGEDDSLYKIDTGELLIRKITVAKRNLELIISKNGLSYTQTVTVNFSNLSEDKVGLYYYNDPSSISNEEEGSAKYIGFSEKVVEINNYVLFIPEGNYIELTDTSNLITQWQSCAVVFHNISKTSLTFRQGDTLIETSVPNYGYLIIGTDGLIKTISTSYDPNNMITLASGEYLLAPKYLDSLINGSPFKPVTKLTVGTPVKIYDFFGEATKVQDVVDAINLIPDNLTLADEPLILDAQAKYNSLTSEDRLLVTNYEKLVSSIVTLESLKEAQALANKKQEAINTLNETDLSKYRQVAQVFITNLINDTIAEINNANDIMEVQSIFDETLSQIDQVLTIEEFDAYQITAITAIQNYFNADDYTEEIIQKVDLITVAALQLIDSALTIKELDGIVENTKAEIDTILTEAALALREYIEQITLELNNYVNLSRYTEENKVVIELILENYEEQISKATNKAKVDSLFNQAKGEINSVPKITSNLNCNFSANIKTMSAIFVAFFAIAYLYFRRQ